MANNDGIVRSLLKSVVDFLCQILARPGGIIYVSIVLAMVIIGIMFWQLETVSGVFPYVAIGAVIFFVLLTVIIYFLLSRRITWRKLKGRYFIGIDMGSENIDYSLVDYKEFELEHYDRVKVLEGRRETPKPPRPFSDVYPILGDIIKELSIGAQGAGIKSIDGIGIGLPGQVDPKDGVFITFPGFPEVQNELFTGKLAQHIQTTLSPALIKRYPKILEQGFPIEIDNDARCATRYVWKVDRLDDVICIFVGNGLGSGVVLGGEMLYGYNFAAGEIGHVTISEGSKFLEGVKCMCRQEGGHWEMYVSSYGMINIAQKLNSKEYMRLKEEYETIIEQEKYQTLLVNNAECQKHSTEHFDNNGELTSYFFSLAFYAGDEYATKVVRTFIKYLAIGIANYVNVLNPRIVHLAGGMIEAFYTDSAPVNTEILLREEFGKYALPAAARDVAIQKGVFGEMKFANVGAALIFKDQSYFDYKK